MSLLDKKIVSGSIVLLALIGIFQVLNYLYHFSMARLLSVAEYGVLATLFSIIYVFSIFSESIQTILTKYSSDESDSGKLKNLFKRSLKHSSIISIIIILGYLIVSIPLSYMLKIPYGLMALNSFILLLSFFAPVTRGILQGRKKFLSLGTALVVEGLGKLILGFIFVFIGWKIYGALVGTIIGLGLSFVFSFLIMKDIRHAKEKKANVEGIYQYSMPVFIIMICILLFYSLDIVIAKIMFDAETAGDYAIASTLAKIIFLCTQPISKAMFPFSASKDNPKGKSKALFTALVLCIAGIIASLIIFFYFPDFIVHIFSGKDIPSSVSILFYLGITFSLLSISNIILSYKLSIGKTKGAAYFILFVILQILVMVYFSSSLLAFSLALLATSAIFLLASLVVLE